jgi:copper chaperone CopZ
MEGILRYNLFTKSFTVTVTFDDKKTNVEKIVEQLSKGGYPVLGDPKWVK